MPIAPDRSHFPISARIGANKGHRRQGNLSAPSLAIFLRLRLRFSDAGENRRDFWGPGGRIGSAPSASAPPGQRSSGSNEIIWCHVLVKCALVLGLCLGQCVVSWLAIFVCCLVCHQDRLRAEPPSWGPSDFVWLHVWVLRHWGRLPWWGGLRTPRYHGPLG